MRFIREFLTQVKLAKRFKLVVCSFCLLGWIIEVHAKDSSMILFQPTQLAEIDHERIGVFSASNPNLIINAGGYDIQSHSSVNSIELLKLDHTDKAKWESIPWTKARSWGATVQWGNDIILIGGVDDKGVVSSTVTRLHLNGSEVELGELLPLPHPIAACGAAILGNTLYVVCGLRSLDANHAENALWALDLSHRDSKWIELEPLPGTGRFIPIVVAQYDVLHVIGGREIATTSQGRHVYKALNESWVYRSIPLESTTQRGWQRRTNAPRYMSAGSAAPSGQSQILVLGYDVTESVYTPLALGAYNKQSICLYNTVTDSWVDTHTLVPNVDARIVQDFSGSCFVLGGIGSKSIAHVTPMRTVRNLAWIDYIVIAAYFACMALIGLHFSRKQETSADFSLGNRKVAWWAAGISMFATGASAISFMAIPAMAFSTNLVWMLPSVMFILGYFINSRFIYPLLRKLEITSTYEYLERRFNKPLRLIASFQQILFQIFGKASVVLVLPSLAISATTGISVFKSVLIMGALTTVYTAIGGFKAVIWTEVFQGALKVLAPLIMIIVAIRAIPGGVGEFIQIGKAYHKFDLALVTWDLAVPAFWLLFMKTLMEGTLQHAGDQPIIQRVFSTPPNEVRRVSAMMAICALLISVIVNIMGVVIFAYFHTHPTEFDAGAQNDQIVPLFAVQAMPVGIAGMIIAAIFASAMATVAGSMNSVATIFTEDFYNKIKPLSNDAERLQVLRTACYLAGIIATAMALVLAAQSFKSMLATWNQIQALLGGGVVGVYSLGMFTRRANGVGAVCGAIISVAVTLLVKNYTSLHWGFYTPVAIGSCMLSGYIISLIFKESKSRDLTGLTVFTSRTN
jgi:SSS family transporter